jgi:hypothetical protein
MAICYMRVVREDVHDAVGIALLVAGGGDGLLTPLAHH